MPVTLRIAQRDYEELRHSVLADMPREAAAFALAGSLLHGNNLTIPVRRTLPIPGDLVTLQREHRLEFSSQAINGLASLCEANQLGAVICHSHPTDIPYSPSDDTGERRISDTLRAFTPSDVPMASLLFWPDGVTGRVWLRGKARPVPLNEIIVVGRCLKRIRTHGADAGHVRDDRTYSRQILAFGKKGQAAIAATKVGIVGVGGTGSSVAEQLVRLGVTDIVLVDPDNFECSNLTRVYGTFTGWPLRRRRTKVALVAKHLRRINPAASIAAVSRHVALTQAARALLDRDIIFLCTDDHWGRSIVNQIAYQYVIPTINLGTRIDSKNGKITFGAGAVDVLRPDQPCLWCKQVLRAERVAAESMPRSTRRTLEREGYVEGIDEATPSVVSITTTLAGLAATLFLQLVTDFMGDRGGVSRLNFDMLEGTVRRGISDIAHACICTKVRGFGDLRGLPTQDNLAFVDQ